jgi:hypothetical protein
VEVAAGHALEHGPNVEQLQIHLPVAEILLEEDLRQVRDGDVLGPPDVAQGERLARVVRGARTAAPAATRQTKEAYAASVPPLNFSMSLLVNLFFMSGPF